MNAAINKFKIFWYSPTQTWTSSWTFLLIRPRDFWLIGLFLIKGAFNSFYNSCCTHNWVVSLSCFMLTFFIVLGVKWTFLFEIAAVSLIYCLIKMFILSCSIFFLASCWPEFLATRWRHRPHPHPQIGTGSTG
jgi:hypothetical protein